MTDFANLVLGIDSRAVKQGVSDLDSLTAAGTRAEAATGSLGTGMKASAVQATAMAAQAQAAARAATGMATGFKASADAARVNTIAMRETLVVARELSRGNFSRIPGSLTLLAQGIGSQGGIKAFASSIGLIKQVQNAELAEQATNAAASAQAIENAAARAAAAVMEADTEVALAEAQLRVTKGTSAEAAAQARLALAHDGVAGAAAEAAIAEDALAAAYARADEAAAASKVATRTTLGTTGAVLIAVGIAATGAALGFEALKTSVADSGVLRDYAESLGLSAKQMDELKAKTDDFALTFGDVWNGVKKAAADALDQSDAWQRFKAGNESAFKAALDHAVNFASQAYGYVAGSYDTIVGIWHNFPNDLGAAFVGAVNLAITQINNLVAASVSGINAAIHAADKLPGINIGDVSAPKIGLVKGGAPGPAAPSFSQNVSRRTAEAKAKINSGLDTIYGDIIDAAEQRIKKEGGNPPKGRRTREKKPNDHGLGQSMDELDAETKGQLALAQAYLVSDAAAMKAEADEKAQKLAIKDHADAAQLAALKEKELALAVANSAATGAKRVNQLRDETADRKTVNDMVAAGIIPASQANDQLQLETQLRPLVAAQSLAEGDAKKLLTQIIKDLTQAHADNVAQMSREKELSTLAANDNEIARLRLEADLIGASNKERAVAIAQLEAEQQLKNMPGLSATEQAAFIQSARDKAAAGVLTPFQQWAQTVPQTAAAVNEALQGIETKGFDGLASAIAGVVTGTESLKQAFGDLARSVISDIIQMTIKMLIFRAITAAFGGGVPSLQATNPGGANYIPPFPSANGNIFSNGSVIAFANGGVVSGPTLFPMSGGRTGLMGEAGPEAIMPLTRDGRGRLGVRAANDPVELIIHTAPSPDAWAQVEQISTSSAVKVTVQAAPQIVKAAVKGTMLASSRPKLMGR